jgi:RES domain-containing protein
VASPTLTRVDAVCYRAHDPRWAFAPASGAGAAVHGGRFNPKGQPALYLALAVETVFKEVTQGLPHRFDPLTVCAYDVACEGIADLTDPAARAAAGVRFEDMACAWMYELAKGRRPRSWDIHAQLAGAGAAGILVPSFARFARPDERNLVLWTWSDDPPQSVRVVDRAGGCRATSVPG